MPKLWLLTMLVVARLMLLWPRVVATGWPLPLLRRRITCALLWANALILKDYENCCSFSFITKERTAHQKGSIRMKSTTNIQSNGLTTARNNNTLQSRVRMVLASTGIAGTMLMGSLLGFHGVASAATVHMTKSNTAVVAQDANSYVAMARQA